MTSPHRAASPTARASPEREGSSAWKAASRASRATWIPQRHTRDGARWGNVTPEHPATMGSPTGHAAVRTTDASRASGPDSSILQVRQPLTGAT